MGKLENSEQLHKIKLTDLQKYFFQAIKWSQEHGGSAGLFPKGRLENKLKGQENCLWIGTKFHSSWDHFYWLSRKSFCSKNTNVNVLPWTQGRFPLPGEQGGPQPQSMLKGLFCTAQGCGGEGGQNTCANLEPQLGADPGKRTAEPWSLSWKDAETYAKLSWRRNTMGLSKPCSCKQE